MKRHKIYRRLIILVTFASILASLLLPYLQLNHNDNNNGYDLDYRTAAMNSNRISKIAKEEDIAKTIIYNIAKSIIQGKDENSIKNRLIESEYYVIDMVRGELEEKVSELEELGPVEVEKVGFFDLIELSIYVIKHLEQNTFSGCLIIIITITTMMLSILYILSVMKQYKNYYNTGKIISLINIILSVLGMIATNAISIGALQYEKFHTSNWGTAWFLVIILNGIILLISILAEIDQKYVGIVTWKMIRKQKQLILMSVPFIIYALIFNYGPLVGWTMAIQNFKPSQKGNQVWVAWDKFVSLFSEVKFLLAFRNTVAMSAINLILSTSLAIIFALLLNEVVRIKGKKLIQTISYLPHFLSWIIVAAIVRNVLALDGGIINELLVKIGILDTPINFFADSKYFWWIVALAVVWKETGWNSIIYLASITSINPDLYESASIDGAGRFQKMRHITLPGIKPTIMVLLIINLGMIMNSGFEAQYQLKNDIILNTAEVIDTYVLNKSFNQGADWSIGTAAGIFKSIISIGLITIANYTAKIFGQERLY